MGGEFAWRLALIFFSFDFRDAWRMGSFLFDGADLVQCSAFDGWRWDNK
jgi:hypothetical protein